MPLPVRRRGVVAITTWCSRVVGRTHTRCSSSIGTAWLRHVWALERYRRVVLRAIRPLPTSGQRDGKMAGGGEGHVVDARCRNSHLRSGRRGAHQSAVAESAITAHVRPAPSPLGLLLDGRLTVAVRCPGEKRATARSHRSRRVAWIAAQRWPWTRQNGPAAHGRRPASRCRRASAGATQRASERATRRAEGNTRGGSPWECSSRA